MAALGWLPNLGFAGGGISFSAEGRITTIAASDRSCDIASADNCNGLSRDKRRHHEADGHREQHQERRSSTQMHKDFFHGVPQ